MIITDHLHGFEAALIEVKVTIKEMKQRRQSH